MDGKWLKVSGSIKGYDFGASGSTTATSDPYQVSLKDQYSCVSYDPSGTAARVTIYDKAGTQIGYGNLHWRTGTTDDWLAAMEVYLDSAGDYQANGADIAADVMMIASMTDSATKGSFKSFGMTGTISNPSSFGWYGGKLNAKIVEKLPFLAPPCGFVVLP